MIKRLWNWLRGPQSPAPSDPVQPPQDIPDTARVSITRGVAYVPESFTVSDETIIELGRGKIKKVIRYNPETFKKEQ
jgi:hypothetical protein